MFAAIDVEIDVTGRFVRSETHAEQNIRVRVDHVDELRIALVQPYCGISSFEIGTCRVES